MGRRRWEREVVEGRGEVGKEGRKEGGGSGGEEGLQGWREGEVGKKVGEGRRRTRGKER